MIEIEPGDRDKLLPVADSGGVTEGEHVALTELLNALPNDGVLFFGSNIVSVKVNDEDYLTVEEKTV